MGLNNPFNYLNKYFGWNSDLFTNLGGQADSPVVTEMEEAEQPSNQVGPVQTESNATQQDNQSYAQPAQQEQAYQIPNLTQRTQDILPTVYAPALGLGADPSKSVGMDAKWQIDPNNLNDKLNAAEQSANEYLAAEPKSGDPRLPNNLMKPVKDLVGAGAWLMDQFAPEDDPLMNGANFDSSNELYDNYYASQGYDKDAQDTESSGDFLTQARRTVGNLAKSAVEETAASQTGNEQYADLARQSREASKGKDGTWWNTFLKGSRDTMANAVASTPIGMANAVDPEQAELGLTMNETEQQHENIRNDMKAAGLDDDWQHSSDELSDAWKQHQEESIDDGTMSYSNLTSNWVTGKQLKAQVAAGLTPLYDMDLDDVDDNRVYSKRDLQLNNGYTPYLPDGASMQNLVEQNAMGMPSKIESAIANSRENMTSYDMTVDDQTVNSKDFDRNKAYKWLTDPSTMNEYTWTNRDGFVWYPNTDQFAIADDGNIMVGEENPETEEFVLGKITGAGRPGFLLADGTPITFDDVDEMNAFIASYDNFQRTKSGDEWTVYQPSYTLPSGQQLTYDQVARLYNDTQDDLPEKGDGKAYDGRYGVSYDFGPLNIGKPKELIEAQDNIIDHYFNPMADAVPSFWDLASTSVPYIADEIAYPMALSDAYMMSINVDPWRTKVDGSMQKAADDLSEETKDALRAQGIDPDQFQDYRTGDMGAERAAAYALTPLSEAIFGDNPAKEYGERGFTKLLNNTKFGKNPLLKAGLNIIGEGLEEIPGNIFEEGTTSGLSRSWFGDYLKGEDGKELTDESGNRLISQDKDITSKFNHPEQLWQGEDKSKDSRSFWDDAQDSFFGGAALGGGFTLPKTAMDIKRDGFSGRKSEASDEVWDPRYEDWKSKYESVYGPVEE